MSENYSDSNLTLVCSRGSIRVKVNIGEGHGLVPNRRQAVTLPVDTQFTDYICRPANHYLFRFIITHFSPLNQHCLI